MYFKNRYLNYKEKYINLKNNIIKILLIPHAGKKYAGNARQKCFKKVKRKINQIFYVTAVHRMYNSNHLFKNNIYIENDNLNIFNDEIFIKKFNIMNEDQKKIIYKEHSYSWVKDEIIEYFGNPNITIIYPNEKSSIDKISSILHDQLKKLDTLVIGTTDFIHYGKNYGLSNWKNPQENKIKLEGEFINDICNINLSNVENFYKKHNFLCCGFISIKTILLTAAKMKLLGTVVDYYDSHQSKFNDIRRYSINQNVNTFVSYAGITFSVYKKKKLNNCDIKLGLGGVRSIINSVITNTSQNRNANKYIPKFTNWWYIKNGIFVGTEFKGKTNSSYGNYQNIHSSAENIFRASLNCYNDSLGRWKLPITLNHIDNQYKIEILDPEEEWKEIKSIDLKPKHYNYGLYLIVNMNNRKYSATYLPGVWQEHFTNNPNDVLKELTYKATSNKDFNWKDDNNSTVKLYASTKYLSEKTFSKL